MSQFIVPLSNLPTITPIADAKKNDAAQAAAGSQLPFASVLQKAVSDLAASSEVSQEGMYDLAMSNNDDLHTGAIQALKTSTAVSFTAGLTSAAIRAYNELMRMQI